jgi:hypothetical protein
MLLLTVNISNHSHTNTIWDFRSLSGRMQDVYMIFFLSQIEGVNIWEQNEYEFYELSRM